MRVLMVSDVYFPRVNGVSTSIETFRRTLAAEGVAVRLVVPRYGDEPEQPDVIRVAGRPVPGDPEDRLVGWRAMHRIVEAEAENCDLIHIQTPFVAHYAGLRAARRLGRPVLATYHTLFEEYVAHYAPWLPAGWLREKARRWSRRQCDALDAVVVPSQAMAARLRDYGVQAPLHILPTGIPLAGFAGGDRRAFRHRYGILSSRPVALYVGRVAHEKNLGFLLQAMVHARQLRPDLLLVIAGEGPALEAVRQEIRQRGLRDHVQCIGYLDRQRELPDCYAGADLFVFASRTETQGLVLLEAMAAGLPVVALAEMGAADVLVPGRGACIPADDPADFGRAMGELLNRPQQRRELCASALRYAAEWSDEAMARRLAALYRSLVPAPAPGQPSPELALAREDSR